MTGELRAKLTESEENMESVKRSSEEAEVWGIFIFSSQKSYLQL